MRTKILIILIMFSIGHLSYAQTVSYTYKPFAAEGCSVTYSVARQDTTYYIIAIVESDRLNFMKESTMLVKNFDNEILELKGNLINTDSESTGIISGNIVYPVSSINQRAIMNMSDANLIFSKRCVKNKTVDLPIEHERTFTKDKIGKKLYSFFHGAKE